MYDKLNSRIWWHTGCLLCALSVSIGALGAHRISIMHNGPPGSLEMWKTAVHYQFLHSIGILLMSNRMAESDRSKVLIGVAMCHLLGIMFFSGSIYFFVLGQIKSLGLLPPIGGSLFVIGWVLAAFYLSNSVPSTKNVV